MKRKSTPLKVLVTGGPTRAYLDRVRYLSNFSSGRMAYSICQALLERGAEVALVAGPTSLKFDELPLKHFLPVETTEEMHSGVMRFCRTFRPSHGVFSAAVLDFTPGRPREGKVSSNKKKWTLSLKPAPKIIDEVARHFPQVNRIGFKLEWERSRGIAHEALGRRILRDRNWQGLCLNFLSEIQAAPSGSHPAYLFWDGHPPVRVRTREEVAQWIVRKISLESSLFAGAK